MIRRRQLFGGSLALVAFLFTAEAANAKEFSLGKATQIKVGQAKIFTVSGSRVLVYRQSAKRHFAFLATCPNDENKLNAADVLSGKITCSQDNSVFNSVSGKKISGPGVAGLDSVPIRLANGFLFVKVAKATATPPGNSGTALLATTSVPVGGGIKTDSPVGRLMIVQPTKGSFAAFSAICTHAGCEVSKATSSAITCTCHNSDFSTANGSVLSGPASSQLKKYEVLQRGGMLYLK